MHEVPDELIRLERSAEEERGRLASLTGDEYDARLHRRREASQAVQEAITAHAAATQTELEQAAKKAVRHPPADPASE
ncbi:hypothetical protein ACFY8B_35105 [Streptomyces sp. NPDC012751]|uniref:hypothetical protein n=1 Tax=Streptomyces sp. NPDC012751 TaxID=3364846 RepID=UPI003690C225